jgi:hypothetical protein
MDLGSSLLFGIEGLIVDSVLIDSCCCGTNGNGISGTGMRAESWARPFPARTYAAADDYYVWCANRFHRDSPPADRRPAPISRRR